MDKTLISKLVILLCSLTPSYQYQKEHNEVYNNERLPHTSSVSGKGNNLDKVIDDFSRPMKKPTNFSCHVCHSATDGNCSDFTSLSSFSVPAGFDEDEAHHFRENRLQDGSHGFPHKCKHENSVCMVRKFAFSQSNGTGHSGMKTFAVKRNCTEKKKCENGCVVMGERTRIYVCSTCCTTPLCNIGNGAAKMFETSWTILMLQVISTLSIIVALKVYTL